MQLTAGRATALFSHRHPALLAWQVELVLPQHSMDACAEDVDACRGHSYICPQRFLFLF